MAEQSSVWRAEVFDPTPGGRGWHFWGWVDHIYTLEERARTANPRSWIWRFIEYRRVKEEQS